MPYQPTQPTPTIILGALFVVGNVGVAIYSATGASAAAFNTLYGWVAIPWALAWWIRVDCRKRGVGASIDQGTFVFYAWAFAVPYYLFKTRGLRGCSVLLGMIGMFLASVGVAAIVYFVLLML